jgi:hypothetical protein
MTEDIISNTGDDNINYVINPQNHTGANFRMLMPLHLIWKPLKGITTYELALCLPFLLRQQAIMPHEFDETAAYASHWIVSDPNKS